MKSQICTMFKQVVWQLGAEWGERLSVKMLENSLGKWIEVK